MTAWGDVPTWITTLAVGFGAVQLFQDRQGRKRQAELDARTQAGAVSAWAGSLRATPSQAQEYGLVIANDSGLPIRDVSVDATLHGKPQTKVDIVVLPAGRYFVTLEKDAKWDYPAVLEEFDRYVRPYTRTERYRVDEITFTDTFGSRWSIDARGRLQRVTLRGAGPEATAAT